MSNSSTISEERQKVLAKIQELESKRIFDVDVEQDPPTIPLKVGQVDYLHKKLRTKIMAKYSFYLAHKAVKKLTKMNQFKIEAINGIENLDACINGAVITCNHFHAFDSFAMELTFENSVHYKNHKKMFRVIREGNYTAFKGFYGKLMKYCNTLPLSSNLEVMREFINASNKILQRGDFLLVYAEESMWWNYRKPKPLKPGAFRFAIKNNVPVVPIFITLRDSDVLDPNGYPVQLYTINIAKPLYPDKGLSLQKNISLMRSLNYLDNVQAYEAFYNEKMRYK